MISFYENKCKAKVSFIILDGRIVEVITPDERGGRMQPGKEKKCRCSTNTNCGSDSKRDKTSADSSWPRSNINPIKLETWNIPKVPCCRAGSCNSSSLHEVKCSFCFYLFTPLWSPSHFPSRRCRRHCLPTSSSSLPPSSPFPECSCRLCDCWSL